MNETNRAKTSPKKKKRVIKPRFYLVIGCFLALIAVITVVTVNLIRTAPARKAAREEAWLAAHATPVPTPTPEPTPTPTPTAIPYATPHAVPGTGKETYGMTAHIEADNAEVTVYQRETNVSFGSPDTYTSMNGILGFRGNNYRDSASFATTDLSEYAITEYAHAPVGALTKGSGSGNWSGCGWTGQPLIIRWADDVRESMSTLKEPYRTKYDFVEVIYPAEDGCIYFFDLQSGQPSRQPLDFRMPFKGTGCIDPRGWPILYVGTGDEYTAETQKSRAMIISLIDGSVLYEFGIQGTDKFAQRKFYAYDSSPLVDAATDTLVWPGENGVVYTMKLNTSYSAAARTLSITPSDIVKFRYDSARSYTGIDQDDATHKWLGYEGSAAAWRGYLYLSSNDGLLQCLDMNTMELLWVADTIDDTNSSPVLEVISDDEAYLYVGTSLHFTRDGNNTGKTPFFKVNALTGEIVGQYVLTCETVSGVSGGIQATAAIGQNKLSDLIYVPFARYGGKEAGVLVALNKETMEPVWTHTMEFYSWSSPVIVYDSKGNGVVLEADAGGYITMLDGLTGEVKCRIRPTETTFEASPAVYEDKMVLGCRGGQTIFFLRLS